MVRGFMEMVVFRINKRFRSEIKKAKLAKKEIISAKVKMTLIHESLEEWLHCLRWLIMYILQLLFLMYYLFNID